MKFIYAEALIQSIHLYIDLPVLVVYLEKKMIISNHIMKYVYGHKLKIVSFFIPYVQTGINYLLFILTIVVLTKRLNRDKFLASKKEQNNKI